MPFTSNSKFLGETKCCLLSFLVDLPFFSFPNVLILFITNSVDFKNEKFQKVKRYSTSIDIKIKNIPLDKYAIKELDKDGFTIDNQSLSLLCSYCPNLSFLNQSLEVLKCYKRDNKTITDSDIKLLINKPLDDNVYQLVEAVLSKNKKDIFSCYNDLKILNIQPSFLVNMLINKFQELYNVNILSKSGSNQADIAEIFNVSPGRAYYMIKNAKSTNIKEIKENLKELNMLEVNIKSGKIDQSLGLELYFLR